MSARPPFEPLREPLDAEEAALAGAYRKVSSEEPSSALDAHILAQARAAVGRPARRPRPWFLGAGFGAAAAAVMAAGIAWQLGWLGGLPGTAMKPGASSQRDRAAGPRTPPKVEETIDIEYVKQEQKARADAAPATSAPADMRRQNAATAAPPAPAAPVMAPAPAPAVKPEPAREEAAPEPELRAPEPQPFPAEAPAAAELAAPPAGATRERSAESDAAGGMRLGVAKQATATLPSWTEDETLAPDAWLERIRDRVDRGDRQSARFSLQRFEQVHPQWSVPRDLQRLLVE